MEHPEVKLQLLSTCRSLFLKFGYGKVTVDEIAREMGISKKTIYVYFPGKKKILLEVMEGLRKDLSQGLEAIWAKTDLPFPTKCTQAFVHLASQLSVITPYNIADMQKHTPEIWEYVKQIKKDYVYQTMFRYLEEGKRQGVFAADFSSEILVLHFSATIHHLLDASGAMTELPKHLREAIPSTREQTFEAVVNLMFRGILKAN